jgi:hypothetical protein
MQCHVKNNILQKATNDITTTCLEIVDFFTYLQAFNSLECLFISYLYKKLNCKVKTGCLLKFLSLPMIYFIGEETEKLNRLGISLRGNLLFDFSCSFTGQQ